MNRKYLIKILACILLLNGCSPKAGTRESPSSAASSENTAALSDVESPAAEALEKIPGTILFESIDLEGNTVNSEVFANSKLTMVNVWATYCSPCLSEMPELGELAGEYAPEDFQVIGVVSDVMEGAAQEDLDYVASLVSQTGADYIHLLLNESIYNAMLAEVAVVPTTFFFDENGTLLETVVGAKKKSDWKEKIDGFLGK